MADGTNGISYSINTKSDNVIGKYSGDDISYSGKVEFYVTKIISNVSSEYLDTNDVVVKAYLGGVTSNETEVQYDYSSNLWSINVNNTPSAFVLISVTEKSTGMFYTSSVIPFITPGKDGSYSAPQTLKGGPLRMRGTWVSGTEYFDGTVATSDGIMYQDVVVYNNVYYVCLNSEELRKNNWLSTPSSVSYWQQIAFSDSFISEYLIANKGFIKEFSSEEVVIMDGDEIVAGMTSSKQLTNSLLPSDTIKNYVRIWAGEISNSDLTTAPFTVTSNGNLTAHTATLYDATFYAENAQVKITNERFVTAGQAAIQFEYAGISISGNSEEYGDSKMFFGMQTSYPINIGGVYNPKTSIPVAFVKNENNKVRITPGRISVDGENANLTVSGTTYLNGYTQINKLGKFIRNDSLKANLDDQCSISINAGTFGNADGSSYTITLPDSLKGRDIIIVNPRWDSLIIQAPVGYTLYKSGSSVSQVNMHKYTMAHAVQISDKAWIIGMMS